MLKGCPSEKWQFSGSLPQISGVDVLPPPPSFLPPPSLFKTVHFDAGSMEEEAGAEQFIPVEVIPKNSSYFSYFSYSSYSSHFSHFSYFSYSLSHDHSQKAQTLSRLKMTPPLLHRMIHFQFGSHLTNCKKCSKNISQNSNVLF